MIESVVVFEVHYSNINRYVIPFVNFLIEKGAAKKYYVVYPSFVEVSGIDKKTNSDIAFLDVDEYYKEAKKDRVNRSLFFNYSYRLADLYWTHKFRRLGFRCFQQQHGMYADFLKRSFLGYFSTIKRKWFYLKYLLYFALRFKITIFLYLINKDFLKSKKINDYLSQNKDKLESIKSHHVLIWGQFWKEWFCENQFYLENEDFTVIGNPDYHKFIVNNKASFKAEEVCYIAQTFVEDGRMESADYRKVINALAKSLKHRLVVKLHPRSNKELFQGVVDNGGLLTYDFPVSGTYVGHYSSMLALALNMNARVYLLSANNESIPHYFKDTANKVFESTENLVETILEKDDTEGRKEISYYFENKKEHPFELIYSVIIKDFENAAV